MSTEFSVGYIHAISKNVANADDLELLRYDALILGSSWDSRSSWLVTQRNLAADLGILIIYHKMDLEGRQKRHNKLLYKYLKTVCRKVKIIFCNSHDVIAIWKKLAALINENEKPVNTICFDITAIPKFCSLATLGAAMAAGRVVRITFVYSEGNYDCTSPKGEADTFHEGDWQAIPIPFFEGEYDPLKGRHYSVSVGFEGRQTYRVVQDGEPDRVSILFPRPGVKKVYEKRAQTKNVDLIKEYCVKKSEIIYAAAGDAIEAWKKLHLNPTERPDLDNSFYLCCGTKPHALALGLRALTLQYPTVLYYVADLHTVTDVKSIGIYWRYDIANLSHTNLES